jgi:4-amino-4-deoxy-L-arabinose transferase-like glycosyltransferase
MSSAATRVSPAEVRGATRGFGFWLGVIVAFGLAIRVAHTLLVAPWPPGLFNDELYYRALAQLVADGEGFVRPAQYLNEGLSLPTAERAPLYPATLAVLGLLGGDGPDAQRLLGALTGGGTILVLGLLGRRLAGPRAGLLAAGLAAVYPTLVAADGALMTESLYGLFAGLALLAAYRVVEAPGAGRAALLGAVAGLAALTRGEALVLLPVLLVPLLRRPGGLRAAAVVCLAFAVVLAPWTVRNWSVFDRPVLVATEGGETLAGANCDPVYYGDRIGTWSVSCIDPFGRGNEAAETNEAGRKGIRYALDHVDRLPLVGVARLARTWGLYEAFQVPEGRASWVMNLGAGLYFVLVPLAVVGFLLLRRRGVPVWIITAPVITVAIASLLTYGSVRFRHSAELSLVVLAAVTLDRIWARATGTPARTARL